ncbi:MAG: PEP-CTERM sorting domain-containing protein [Acidobacteriia bacterium]|nr:PEP-CTERM sorting domain-containing protein [Terriglobia bacterium]
MTFRPSLTIALAVSLVAISKSQADPMIYVVSAGLTGNGVFGTIDLNSGAYQQVGPGEPDGYFGLASGANGSLVSLTYASNLDSINPTTGIPTQVGATGLPGCVVPDPSCSPNTAFDLGGYEGKVYMTDYSNNLYVVDPSTGSATLISNKTGVAPFPFVPGTQNADGTYNFVDQALWEGNGNLYETYDAFVFDPTTLSATSIVVAPELYQIDPLTGQAHAIGSTDLGIGAVTVVNGVSYALDDLTGQIETINLSTGNTAGLSSFDPSAGVIQGAVTATPEPSTAALTTAGAIVLLFLGQRRRRKSQASAAARAILVT